MITGLILFLSSVLLLTGSFSFLSVWGTKILYAEKLKDLYDNKNELIKLLKGKLIELKLEGQEYSDDYKNLEGLLEELKSVK